MGDPGGGNRALRQQAVVVPRDGELVEVALVNASVEAAAQAVLSETFGERYVIADGVSARITIQSTGPIPKAALLELFEASLAANGARLIRQGDVVQIVPGTSGVRTFRLASEGVGSGSSVIVAPMEYISAAQMADLLKPLVDEGLTVLTDRPRNLVMLSGDATQLEAALDALNLFDVDVLQGKSIALVELNSADPEAIVEELKVIFETEEGGSLDGVLEFVPNDRLGSVLIISSRSRYLDRAQRWIAQLDRTASGANNYTRMYPLRHRNPADVAPIIGELIARGENTGETEAGTPALARVVADDNNSAIIVIGNRTVHRDVERLIREIDMRPQQVMLEATIAEVQLNDELSLGVRWFFQSGNFGFRFTDDANASTGPRSPGFSAIFSAGQASAALNALAGVTNIRIISSPTLMVLNNEEAVLQIGDEVPVATQSSTDVSLPDAPTVTSIEYRNTGVILTVQPRINRSGQVVLDVAQEISSVAQNETSGIDSPTIRQRRIETNVLLSDGMTLALGGLVQEQNDRTVSKVPGLGDAPFIGSAFRSTDSTKRRVELLVLIRPRVVDSASDAERVTAGWRARLSGANSLLGTGLGSPNHTVEDLFP
ncbi:MAG: hypothetical protein N838_11980 [Thiohalocapsa sp. PB-PSB1]|nr:MAG: hypothetical protein N838_11980 [Thiohalocapsa sp. PB-PSB1]MBL4543488.1 type II secretion system secretin GspD [Paracoccaceae bacterium]